MSKYVNVEDMKVGDKYFFVDTNFNYADVPLPVVKERTVYRIVGGDFSTKENEDRYEVIHVIAHKTEEEARAYAVKELRRYKEYMDQAILKRIVEIS